MPWEQVTSILQEARNIAEEERTKRPQACPNDGEPLSTGPDGKLFCKFDGWKEDDS